jgi:hypothetical protein
MKLTPLTSEALEKSKPYWFIFPRSIKPFPGSKFQTPLEILCERLELENQTLKELVDSAYTQIELYKPEGEYNRSWKSSWLEKARKLVPGCSSLDS